MLSRSLKKIESRKNENFFTSKEREVLNSLRDKAVLSENTYINLGLP